MEIESPYLSFAFFCERFLQEQDGVLSAIRMVDKLTLHRVEQQGALPQGMPIGATPIQTINLLIGLKSGNYKGSGTVRVRGFTPSGKELTPKSDDSGLRVELKGQNEGANVILVMALTFSEEGIYWFDVYFNDRLVTRAPLSVSVLETQSPSEGSPLQMPLQ